MIHLLFQLPTGPQVLDRFLAFQQSYQSLDVDVVATRSSSTIKAKGEFSVVKPNSMYFNLQAPGLNYSYIQSGFNAVEFEKSSKIYSTSIPSFSLETPDSAISGAIGFGFPTILLPEALAKVKPNFEYVDSPSIDGVVTDHIQTKSKFVDQDLYVDKSGYLIRLVTVNHMINRRSEAQMDFTNYRVNKPLAQSKFDASVPMGYSPFALPSVSYPLAVDEQFPTSDWSPRKGGVTIDKLRGSKPALLVLVDSVDAPGSGFVETMKTIQTSGVTVGLLTNSPKGEIPAPLGSLPTFYDPQGASLAALNAPGTPLFFLIDKDAKITNLWLGFDADHPEKFKKQVAQAVSGQGK